MKAVLGNAMTSHVGKDFSFLQLQRGNDFSNALNSGSLVSRNAFNYVDASSILIKVTKC